MHAWERRHAVLVTRAEMLDAIARDHELSLTERERATLRSVAGKLRIEAHELLRSREP